MHYLPLLVVFTVLPCLNLAVLGEDSEVKRLEKRSLPQSALQLRFRLPYSDDVERVFNTANKNVFNLLHEAKRSLSEHKAPNHQLRFDVAEAIEITKDVVELGVTSLELLEKGASIAFSLASFVFSYFGINIAPGLGGMD